MRNLQPRRNFRAMINKLAVLLYMKRALDRRALAMWVVWLLRADVHLSTFRGPYPVTTGPPRGRSLLDIAPSERRQNNNKEQVAARRGPSGTTKRVDFAKRPRA